MGTDGQAWYDLGADGWPPVSFTWDEVRRHDVDAMRLCDGFEYHYHRGGRLTWFGRSSHDELVLLDAGCLPHDEWRHLSGCACEGCCPGASEHGAAGQPGGEARGAG